MGSWKLIFAFTFAIKLFINVVPSSAKELSTTEFEPSVDIGNFDGTYSFGEKFQHEEQITPDIQVHDPPDRHWFWKRLRGGVRDCTGIFKNANGRTITRIELISHLGPASSGERVRVVDYDYTSVEVTFRSKPHMGINYTVRLFGLKL